MAPRAKDTRERIVETARHLFNEHGYGAVTTAALAEHCGLAEGNLWYHFKTKRALLDVLGERFALTIEARLRLMPEGDPVAAYARMLAEIMTEFRDFRFLYRDQHSYGEHPETVRGKVPGWIARTYSQLEAHLAALVVAGFLDWPRERLGDLSINATIMLRYGLDHYRELGEATGEGSQAVKRTLARHLTLFEHRLTPDSAALLHLAIQQIGATGKQERYPLAAVQSVEGNA